MKRVTVKDIANEVNVSLCTVNKALTGKSGISKNTKEKIIEAANRMGYRVNKVAQSMARKPIIFGIIIPRAWPQIFDLFKEGINEEIELLRDHNVTSKMYEVDSPFYSKQVEDAIRQCAEDGVNAVILLVVSHENYYCKLHNFIQNGIPVVYLGVDGMENEPGWICVKVDGIRSGKMAAEIMGCMVKKDGQVAVMIGNKDINDHADKVKGFVDESKMHHFNIIGVYEHQDEKELSYILTKKIIKDYPGLSGIYIATGNSVSVCEFIDENQLANQIVLITTDLFAELRKYIEKRIIKVTLYQNQIQQGKNAVRLVFSHLTQYTELPRVELISPIIVINSNMDLF